MLEWSDDIPDIIQTARLQVYKDRPWYVGSVPTLVVVDIDPLQLEVGRPLVLTIGGDAMLLRDNLPELCSYLIATLTHLVNENVLDSILWRMVSRISRICEDSKNLETDYLPHNWSSLWLRLALVAASNLRLAIVVE